MSLDTSLNARPAHGDFSLGSKRIMGQEVRGKSSHRHHLQRRSSSVQMSVIAIRKYALNARRAYFRRDITPADGIERRPLKSVQGTIGQS
jgi:hypothetical protein